MQIVPLKEFQKRAIAKYVAEVMADTKVANPDLQPYLVLATVANRLEVSVATLYRVGLKAEKRNPKDIFKAGPKVYMMRDGLSGTYKIGFTKNCPHRRCAYLGTGNPRISLLTVWYAPREVERAIHAKFRSKRLSGEWFEFSPSDVCELESFMQSYTTQKCKVYAK